MPKKRCCRIGRTDLIIDCDYQSVRGNTTHGYSPGGPRNCSLVLDDDMESLIEASTAALGGDTSVSSGCFGSVAAFHGQISPPAALGSISVVGPRLFRGFRLTVCFHPKRSFGPRRFQQSDSQQTARSSRTRVLNYTMNKS